MARHGDVRGEAPARQGPSEGNQADERGGPLRGRLHARPSPRSNKAIAEKEAELEALLDGFAGLSPKLKERANKRGEALQKEIDALKRDLADLRIPWENLRADLAARQEALERATSILNQEGHFRQKAEALKTVVGRIVCHFGRKGKRLSPEIHRHLRTGGRGRSAAGVSRISPLEFVSRRKRKEKEEEEEKKEGKK